MWREVWEYMCVWRGGVGVCVWRGGVGVCVCGGEVWECVWREVWEGVYGVVEALPSSKCVLQLKV